MAPKNFNVCNDKPLDKPAITDKPSPYCSPDSVLGQSQGSMLDVDFDNVTKPPKKLGIGSEANCDPMQQSGWGAREQPSRETINRYSQVLRGVDEAMKNLFDDITVTDDNGAEHKIPINIATPEKAIAFILQENVRKDSSFVVDRIPLPMLALYQSDIAPDMSRYMYHKLINYYRDKKTNKPGWVINENGRQRGTILGRAWGIPVNISYQLNIWTLYKEDMNQIIEQAYLKFSPIAYIRIQDVNIETPVKLESVLNQQEAEPGDKQIRVIKRQLNMMVETFIPQPIVRKKAVLDIKMNILENIQDEILGVFNKQEVSAEE